MGAWRLPGTSPRRFRRLACLLACLLAHVLTRSIPQNRRKRWITYRSRSQLGKYRLFFSYFFFNNVRCSFYTKDMGLGLSQLMMSDIYQLTSHHQPCNGYPSSFQIPSILQDSVKP
jgi:hypothetical protein